MSASNSMLLDYFRTRQLTENKAASVSLCVLPSDAGFIVKDSFLQKMQYYKPLQKHPSSFWQIGLLPVSLSQKYNSHHPYGWNSSSMMPAAGYQVQITTGFYLKAGPLQIQLQPEYVYAANSPFEHDSLWGSDDKKLNYHRLFKGQSFISLNFGAASLSVSTQNLWWGPGIYNALMMSTNAPGFLHASFRSNRPLKTAFGSFEWELMGGKLIEDTMVMLENNNLTSSYYNPNSYGGGGGTASNDSVNNWRYVNAFTITYQPKWIKGLYIGMTRVGYAYNNNLQKGGEGFLYKYFPTVLGVFRQTYAYNNDTGAYAKRYKQMLSFHAKYIFEKSHLELHGEYGWDDNFYNVRDFILDIPHSAAYTLGLKKLWQFRKGKWLDLQAELTQLAQTTDYLVRNSGYWYVYQGGYTNQSRIIGAGIGSGNNVQTLSISYLGKGLNKLGIKLLQLQHDPVLADTYAPLITLGLRPVKWTDFSVGVIGNHQYKRFIINGDLQWVTSRNYAWQPNVIRGNFYALLSLSYLW